MTISSVWQILDTGRRGLEFFRIFGPVHEIHTGKKHSFEEGFIYRYYGRVDIFHSALRVDQQRFMRVTRGLVECATDLRNHGDAVFQSWRGEIAEETRRKHTTLLHSARGLSKQFGWLSDVLGGVSDAIDQAVHDKADAVSRLHGEHIDGIGVEEIAFLVDFTWRAGIGQPDERNVARAARLCDRRDAASLRRVDPASFREVWSAVDAWLDEVFVSTYEDRLAAFNSACAAADATLTDAWQRLSDALNDIRADQFDALLAPRPSIYPAVQRRSQGCKVFSSAIR